MAQRAERVRCNVVMEPCSWEGCKGRDGLKDATEQKIASAFAVAVCVAGAYGGLVNATPAPLLLGLAFCGSFLWALRRAASGPAPFQILFVLLLVALSFALHFAYLPAGICCFFTLMVCKSELLLPRRPAQPRGKDL